MRSSLNFNNNNNALTNSDTGYNCSWQPYLTKIDEVINQMGRESLFVKPINTYGEELYNQIIYSTLDLDLPNAIVFIPYSDQCPYKLSQRIREEIDKKLSASSGIKVGVVLGCVHMQFPSFSQDERENYEIKKFIFYNLAAGQDNYAAFQEMDNQYYNAPRYPRFVIENQDKPINFISKIEIDSFQIKRDFNQIEAPLELTCTLTDSTYSSHLSRITAQQKNISRYDNNINLITFKKSTNTFFKKSTDTFVICIPSSNLEKQKRYFYELCLADNVGSIEKFEELFALEISKSTNKRAPRLTSQDCSNLFQKYNVKPPEIPHLKSNATQQYHEQSAKDTTEDNPVSKNYSRLFEQYVEQYGIPYKQSNEDVVKDNLASQYSAFLTEHPIAKASDYKKVDNGKKRRRIPHEPLADVLTAQLYQEGNVVPHNQFEDDPFNIPSPSFLNDLNFHTEETDLLPTEEQEKQGPLSPRKSP